MRKELYEHEHNRWVSAECPHAKPISWKSQTTNKTQNTFRHSQWLNVNLLWLFLCICLCTVTCRIYWHLASAIVSMQGVVVDVARLLIAHSANWIWIWIWIRTESDPYLWQLDSIDLCIRVVALLHLLVSADCNMQHAFPIRIQFMYWHDSFFNSIPFTAQHFLQPASYKNYVNRAKLSWAKLNSGQVKNWPHTYIHVCHTYVCICNCRLCL